MSDILAKLNDMQRMAAMTVEGPVLILAGAGSGKTTVLVNRIAYMIKECSVAPYNILAITFTNKAANELKQRIEKIVPEQSFDVWASTFHSMCVRILRGDIDRLGYDRNFVIYDTSDTKTVIKDCIKYLELDTNQFPVNSIMREISNAKNDMISCESYEKMYAGDFRMSKFSKVYTMYQNTLRQNNALDFDDLINLTVKLFSENADVLSRYQKKFKYIMVDEYQDTNAMQYALVSLLAKEHHNLCVVGDDDQSIYKFRGADIKNILNFEKQFPEAKVIRLEQNYRSTQNILDAANSVISHNKKRMGKELWTSGEAGDPICIYTADNERAEAMYIAGEIDRLVSEQNCNFNDFAILYRTNAQSRIIEEMLLRKGLPYRVLAGLRFYDRKEIKDIVSYLRILVNPNDSVSLKRIINEPKRGIGNTTLDKAEAIARREKKGIFDVICQSGMYSEISRASSKLSEFANLIGTLREMKGKIDLGDLMENVLSLSGYREMLEIENTVESKTRLENIEELQSAVKNYVASADEPSLEGFLEEVSLVSDIDNYDEEQPTVVLMTIHAAKGLEFPIVFVAGCEEGLFPGSASLFNDEELEEERRLCYVALTRAKENLYITHANSRMLFGKTSYAMPSRFIEEIPSELAVKIGSRTNKQLKEDFMPSYSDGGAFSFGYAPKSYSSEVKTYSMSGANGDTGKSRSYKDSSKTDFSSVSKSGLFDMFDVRKSAQNKPECDFSPGDTVEHKKFGVGKVISVLELGNDKKIEIKFESGETRNLMALFANLKKL